MLSPSSALSIHEARSDYDEIFITGFISNQALGKVYATLTKIESSNDDEV